MNKVRVLMILVVALVMLNIGVIGYLFFVGGERPGPPRRPDRLIIEKLQFNEEQVRQFEVLRDGHHAQVMVYQDSMRLLRKLFIDGLRMDHPDHAQAEQYAARVAKLQQKIEMVTFRHFQSLRELCDERQKPLFDQFIQEIARMLGRPPGPPPEKRLR